jgi:hypothetical protein
MSLNLNDPIYQGILPTSTIVPQQDELFIPYFTRTYEAIAQAVNAKDNSYFTIAITSAATNIPNLANFGAFIVCVSGTNNTLPCLTAALSKASATSAGVINVLGSQNGSTGVWSGITLTITSTATNFQIAHSASGKSGNFNIRIIGTQ